VPELRTTAKGKHKRLRPAQRLRQELTLETLAASLPRQSTA
jgi:hypothetical protein